MSRCNFPLPVMLSALTVFLLVMVPAATAADITLFKGYLNVDGTLYNIKAPANPPLVDLSSFDKTTGLGVITVTVKEPGTHTVLGFFDHEIDETTNTFFNEYGATEGYPLPGQSWEIDEPGQVFGDIYTHFVNSELYNDNAVPLTDPDDVSMAIGHGFGLATGQTATVRFTISATPPASGFYLIQTDPDSHATIYLQSSVEIPIPACIDDLQVETSPDWICGMAQLSWTGTGAPRYNIYRSTVPGGDPAFFVFIGHAADNSYLDTNVVAGTTYYYVVRAADGSGVDLCYSNGASAKVPTCEWNDDLQATGGCGLADLTWTGIGAADHYNIYRSTIGGDDWNTYVRIGSSGQTSYEDTNVVIGTTYYYRLLAADASDVERIGSSVASVTIPPCSCLNTVKVVKFYDANANGIQGTGEEKLDGWKFRIGGDTYLTPAEAMVPSGIYTVTEAMPREASWRSTTPASTGVTFDGCGGTATVLFGNLCLGPGGGQGIGFWSNKNGEKLVGSDDLALLRALNLRDPTGKNFDPADYRSFRTWLLKADASSSMGYMLSAQLAAMELNVHNGKVTGSSLIFAPGTKSANTLGYAPVNAVMAEANAELGMHPLTPAKDKNRAYQETLKNLLDRANNNLNFVQSKPCRFSFV
jgi:hypothetical protein